MRDEAQPTHDSGRSEWTVDRYYGIRDFIHGGYDGLIRWRLEEGGLTLCYLTTAGWVEDNALIFDLHDADTRPVTEQDAARVAVDRFGVDLIHSG